MLRRRLPVLMLLFLSLVPGAFRSAWAQTENKTPQTENKTPETESQGAVKFDEFGDLLYSDIMARLDNFALTLQNQPNSRGFLIIYRTRRDIAGLNHRLAMRMKDYLVNYRGIDSERVVTVDGGVAEHLTQELWIVPPGTAPVPRSDARIGYSQPPDSAWKFDEYAFFPPGQYPRGAASNREAEVEYLEAFASEVKKQPKQLACLIAYAQYDPNPKQIYREGDYYGPHPDVHLDPPATARNRLAMDKKYLIGDYGLPASSVKIIDGGYRKRRSIEFWIVPPGEPLPIATPNSFPPGRKGRK